MVLSSDFSEKPSQETGNSTTHKSGIPFILIPDEDMEVAKEEFKDFIFAQFHGHTPEMGCVIGAVNDLWARTGPRIFVHDIGHGTYLLRVNNPKTRESILTRNPWNIAGLSMFVASGLPDFSREKPPLASADVTVEFYGIPYFLFNTQSLDRIATGVGRCISLAPKTQEKETFEVARMLIEVNLQKEIPTKLISGFRNGREFEIDVSYARLPPKCSGCKEFGHHDHFCPTNPPPAHTVRRRTMISRKRKTTTSSAESRAQPVRGRHTITNGSCVIRRGLNNPGNLCFVNATLQALLSCSPFVQLIQGIQLQDIPKAEFPTLAAFSEFIIQSHVPSSSSFIPSMFDAVLRKFTPDVVTYMIGRPMQQDAPEFLTFIMNQLDDELLKFRTTTQSFLPSELSDIFRWQLVKGNNVESYLLFPLAIYPEEVSTIEQALQLFFAPEVLGEYPESTGGVVSATARKSIKIETQSNIMILHLMRFSYERSQGFTTKLQKPLDFPMELNLGGYILVSPPKHKGLRYELVATITHHGTDHSTGHYITHARQKNGQWLRFDDVRVTDISIEEVLDGQAYVLFYQQVLDNLGHQNHIPLRNYGNAPTFGNSNFDVKHPIEIGKDVSCSSPIYQVTGMDIHPQLPILLTCSTSGQILLHHFDEPHTKKKLYSFQIWSPTLLSQYFQELYEKLKYRTEGAVCVAWGCLGNETKYGVGFCEGLIHVYKYTDYKECAKKHAETEAHIGAINDMAFCTYKEKLTMVTCGHDKLIKLWDISDMSLILSYCHQESVTCLAVRNNPGQILPVFFSDVHGNIVKILIGRVGNHDGDACITLCTNGTMEARTELKLSSDGKRLFACSIGHPEVLELDTKTLNTKRVYKGYTNTLIKRMDVSNKYIGVLCGEEKCVKLWNPDSGMRYASIFTPENKDIPEWSMIKFNVEGSLLTIHHKTIHIAELR